MDGLGAVMTWIVEYQATKGAPWVDLRGEFPSSDSAWGYLTFIRVTTNLDYYAACVRPKEG